MTDAVANLARVMQATESEVGFPTYEECAAKVVAYLTSDEAVKQATSAVLGFDTDGFVDDEVVEAARDYRASILAELGVESLPLDPEPWVSPDGKRWAEMRLADEQFKPREGFEQHRGFYKEGGE